jgi:hypothetical protein
MLFVGVDWGETHHDLCLLDRDGNLLVARRIADGLAGVGELHALVATHAEDSGQVVVGTAPVTRSSGLRTTVLGPSGVQSAAGGCLLPVGVRGADGLTRRPALR